MSLSVSSVPYADWQALCPVLCRGGYLPDPEGEGRYTAPEQLEKAPSDQGPWLLLYLRPEVAVARAVQAGEPATKALAQWEFGAGLLLEHYKVRQNHAVLVDLEEAQSHPERFLEALGSHWPGLAPYSGQAGMDDTGVQNPEAVSQVALLVAKALIAESRTVGRLVAQLSSFGLSMGTDFRGPEIDFDTVQSRLSLDGPKPAAEESEHEAPAWLLRQLFHAQEQLNHHYLREESAHAELGQTRQALERLRLENTELRKQARGLHAVSGGGRGLVGRLYRRLKGALGGGLSRRWQLRRQVALVRDSGYFDRQWYLSQNPDIQQAGMDPLRHFVAHGGQEGRAPGPQFDSLRYLTRYPDVAEQGVNPLVHYLTQGRDEGRQP